MMLSDKLACAAMLTREMRHEGEIGNDAAKRLDSLLRQCAIEASALECVVGMRRPARRPPGDTKPSWLQQLDAVPPDQRILVAAAPRAAAAAPSRAGMVLIACVGGAVALLAWMGLCALTGLL